MNTKTTFLFVTLLFIASIAHAQFVTWETLNTGTTKTINDIHFLNADTGYMVGNDYLFKKTVDGGDTWQDLPVPTIGEADGGNGDLVAVNKQVASIFGGFESGIILVWKHLDFTVITSDDGGTYSENYGIDSPVCEARGLNITPLNDNGNGYTQSTVFGQRCSGGAAFAYLYDGPFSVYDVDTSYFGDGSGYTSMDVNPNTGNFVLGHEDGNLLSYTGLWNDPDTIFLDTTGVGAVAYAGNNIWYAATSEQYMTMYKSVNDGLTFQPDSTWFPTFFYPRFRAMEFLENGLGLAGAQSNGLYGVIIVQNGSEWSYYNAEKPINTVAILPDGTAYAAGEDGLLMRTTTPITLGISEIKLQNLITVYPNPTTKTIRIAHKENMPIKEIKLLDNAGKLIESYPVGTAIIDLSQFSPAVYFVRILTDSGDVVKRVVVN